MIIDELSIRRSGIIVLFLGMTFFSFSALDAWLAGYGWSDLQRLSQVALLLLVVILAWLRDLRALSPAYFFSAVFFFAFGGLSSGMSNFPSWAFKEWSVFFGLFLFALMTGGPISSKAFHHGLVLLMVGVASIITFQFSVAYLSAFISRAFILDPYVLMSGFSNPRFLAQFQILALPFIAAFSLNSFQESLKLRGLALGLLGAMQWMICLSLSGRGASIALMAATFCALVLGKKAWRIIALQMLYLAVGAVFYLILFWVVPLFIDVGVSFREGSVASLSGRGALWGEAIQLALDHPWLGVGPMHFAAWSNPIAVHPHQIFLQLLAEWGAPAALLIVSCATGAMIKGTLYVRAAVSESFDLALWISIVSALILAQVDGVFVVAYTQTWLAVLAGIAIFRWGARQSGSPWQSWVWRLLSVPAFFILLKVLLYEAPQVPACQESMLTEGRATWQPRFWLVGSIPWKCAG